VMDKKLDLFACNIFTLLPGNTLTCMAQSWYNSHCKTLIRSLFCCWRLTQLSLLNKFLDPLAWNIYNYLPGNTLTCLAQSWYSSHYKTLTHS
jgi:hypothetical protein